MKQYAISSNNLAYVLTGFAAALVAISAVLNAWLGEDVYILAVFGPLVAAVLVATVLYLAKIYRAQWFYNWYHLLIGVTGSMLVPLLAFDPDDGIMGKIVIVPIIAAASISSLYLGSRFLFVRCDEE